MTNHVLNMSLRKSYTSCARTSTLALGGTDGIIGMVQLLYSNDGIIGAVPL